MLPWPPSTQLSEPLPLEANPFSTSTKSISILGETYSISFSIGIHMFNLYAYKSPKSAIKTLGNYIKKV